MNESIWKANDKQSLFLAYINAYITMALALVRHNIYVQRYGFTS